MDISLFDYNLPTELIAQEPLPQRPASRMMVITREGPLEPQDRHFRDLPEYLRPGDCLVLNDTRVIPARLLGRRPGGGQAEVLLVRELEPDLWEAMVRPGARLREGTVVEVGGGELLAHVLRRGEAGTRVVRLEHGGELLPLLERLGQTPLPPYIRRKVPSEADRERYQTVYADRPGAAAAPTAGLHFDAPMLCAIQEMGVTLARITLHVGLGTFQPVSVERIEDHRMHAEWCEVSEAAAQAINTARGRGGRILAVGTTSVRTLESRFCAGAVQPGSGLTDIFIYPGYSFQVVDGLLTNFHLPRSTLLMLVSAFAGRERILQAYAHAVAQRYRFFSYGDCMLILPAEDAT
jgi:S-adenosylmethionine:tRNA ribosyltransferase-isomerase